MAQPLRSCTLHIHPISLRTRLAHPLPPLDKNKHRTVTHQRQNRNGNKRIPLSLRLNPRRDPIINGKAQRIPYQNYCRDELPTQVTVRGGSYLEQGVSSCFIRKEVQNNIRSREMFQEQLLPKQSRVGNNLLPWYVPYWIAVERQRVLEMARMHCAKTSPNQWTL